ncbi:MAG: hypothetical protein B0D91_08875, partial [Oceanospirillales bacterium LUC14_002_19_P2]
NTDSGKPEKVFKTYQNQCSRLTRMGVQELPESVFKLCQNTQMALVMATARIFLLNVVMEIAASRWRLDE